MIASMPASLLTSWLARGGLRSLCAVSRVLLGEVPFPGWGRWAGWSQSRSGWWGKDPCQAGLVHDREVGPGGKNQHQRGPLLCLYRPLVEETGRAGPVGGQMSFPQHLPSGSPGHRQCSLTRGRDLLKTPLQAALTSALVLPLLALCSFGSPGMVFRVGT